jgi:hypothetical protein
MKRKVQAGDIVIDCKHNPKYRVIAIVGDKIFTTRADIETGKIKCIESDNCLVCRGTEIAE